MTLQVEDLKLGIWPQSHFFLGIFSHFVEMENMGFLGFLITFIDYYETHIFHFHEM